MNGFGMGFDDLYSMKDAAESTRLVADGAGYAGYRVGKLRHKHTDLKKCTVTVCVQEVVKIKGKRKIDATYTAQYVDIVVQFSTMAEAIAAYGSFYAGNFVVFDDNLAIVAVMAWHTADDADEDSEDE